MKIYLTTFAIACCLILCGCTKTIYVPTETIVETHTNVADTTISAQIKSLIEESRNTTTTHEKIIIRDSVIITVNEQGDVLRQDTFKSRDRDYSEKDLIEKITLSYDSIINEQKHVIDSLSAELTEVPLPVEKPMSKWEQLKMDFGALGLLIFFVVFSFVVIWIAKKKS